MTAYKCEVCMVEGMRKYKPCRVTIVGGEMERIDLCIMTGEIGPANFVYTGDKKNESGD